jgi:uncharacterized membrane protein
MVRGMRALYLASVYLHVLAAIAWIGGMIFLVAVLLPALRGPGGPGGAAALLNRAGYGLRTLGWTALGLLLVTGSVQSAVRAGGAARLLVPAFWDSWFGRVLALKLGLFGAILVLSAVHDFAIGPRAARAWDEAPAAPRTVLLRRLATWMGRLTFLLALIVVALAVVLVRGPA